MDDLTHDDLEKKKDDFLEHYGVRGMRWGRRGKNANYDIQQVRRDLPIYGKGGVRRINRSLNDGDKISVARGFEKTRRDRVMGKNKYVRQGGKVAGALGGVVLANVGITAAARAASSQAGASIISRIFGPGAVAGVQSATMFMNAPAVRLAASAGAAKIGEMLSGDIAVSANMRLAGYDPSRK